MSITSEVLFCKSPSLSSLKRGDESLKDKKFINKDIRSSEWPLYGGDAVYVARSMDEERPGGAWRLVEGVTGLLEPPPGLGRCGLSKPPTWPGVEVRWRWRAGLSSMEGGGVEGRKLRAVRPGELAPTIRAGLCSISPSGLMVSGSERDARGLRGKATLMAWFRFSSVAEPTDGGMGLPPANDSPSVVCDPAKLLWLHSSPSSLSLPSSPSSSPNVRIHFFFLLKKQKSIYMGLRCM